MYPTPLPQISSQAQDDFVVMRVVENNLLQRLHRSYRLVLWIAAGNVPQRGETLYVPSRCRRRRRRRRRRRLSWSLSFIAAPMRRISSQDSNSSRPVSKHRLNYERPLSIDAGRRHHSHLRRRRSERYGDVSNRRSPSQPFYRPSHQLPTPMTTPNSSVLSLCPPMEHVGGLPMERTSSGNSIISDDTFEPRHMNINTLTLTDNDAAYRVKLHQSMRDQVDGPHERKLRYAMRNRVELDENVLSAILDAADTIFFNGVLAGRVKWEWSHPSQSRYETELIGTTALRPALQGGFETLIILSDPILRRSGYDRRLLLSAFLHELIHCYLFILCGFDARIRGGHTAGFHAIAEIIDNWVGHGYLNLCNIKANLNQFRNEWPVRSGLIRRIEDHGPYRHSHDGCDHSPERSYRDFNVIQTVNNEWYF
ncbi:hypothetical protein B7494_g1553 [Chlorociboria aeruginascens]|nr:hypothetical protein B7494_g1553 [Chlorociboria aeruginascens]